MLFNLVPMMFQRKICVAGAKISSPLIYNIFVWTHSYRSRAIDSENLAAFFCKVDELINI